MATSASADSSKPSATARDSQVRCAELTMSTSGERNETPAKKASTRVAKRSRSRATTSAAACAPTAASAHRPSGRKNQRDRLTPELISRFFRLDLVTAGGAVVQRGHQRNTADDVAEERWQEKAGEEACPGEMP